MGKEWKTQRSIKRRTGEKTIKKNWLGFGSNDMIDVDELKRQAYGEDISPNAKPITMTGIHHHQLDEDIFKDLPDCED